MRDDARLAAPNTYCSFWEDAANHGKRARRPPAHRGHRERGVATTAAWAQRIGAPLCTQRGSCVNPNGENLIAEPAAEDSHERKVLVLSMIDLGGAQEERLTLNQPVLGSSPRGLTKRPF